MLRNSLKLYVLLLEPLLRLSNSYLTRTLSFLFDDEVIIGIVRFNIG